MGYDVPSTSVIDISDVYGVQLPQAYNLPLPQELPRNATSLGLVSSLVVCAGRCKLTGFSGYSNKGSAQFIQVFDLPAVPADNAVPVVVLAVGAGAGAATGTFSAYWGSTGRWFDRGVVLCNSSTLATKTIGSADTWFDAQYVPDVITADSSE